MESSRDNVSTEDLRIALQRYRTFFTQLLFPYKLFFHRVTENFCDSVVKKCRMFSMRILLISLLVLAFAPHTILRTRATEKPNNCSHTYSRLSQRTPRSITTNSSADAKQKRNHRSQIRKPTLELNLDLQPLNEKSRPLKKYRSRKNFRSTHLVMKWVAIRCWYRMLTPYRRSCSAG